MLDPLVFPLVQCVGSHAPFPAFYDLRRISLRSIRLEQVEREGTAPNERGSIDTKFGA